jgi:hypothetical protein
MAVPAALYRKLQRLPEHSIGEIIDAWLYKSRLLPGRASHSKSMLLLVRNP